MSLENNAEILKELQKINQQINNLKDELNDKLTDNHNEVMNKVHSVDSFCRNILEKNQQDMWNKGVKPLAEKFEITKE